MSALVLIGVLAAAPAQVADSTAPPPPAAAGQAEGVVRYDPAFFAQQRPNTAMEMIERIPGFTFDRGSNVRGFAGAAGNVLVDGDRPTSKDDDLENILRRIPASQVDHIDVIRGGAPGIDMHGRTIIANVVRKTGSGFNAVVAYVNDFYADGRVNGQARIELTKKWDGKTFEFSILPALFVDDGAGDGNSVRTDPGGNVLRRTRLDDEAGGFQVNATSGFETPFRGGKFKINAVGGWQSYYEDADDHILPIPSAGTETLRFRQTRANGELGLHYEKALNAKASIEALAIQRLRHRTNNSLFYDPSGEVDDFQQSDSSGESIARGVLRYTASPTLSAEASLEGAYNYLHSQSSFAINGANIPLPAADVTVKEKRGEASALGTWRPSKHFTLEAGMRAEVSNISSSGDVVLSKTLFFPKPRAVATWTIDDDHQLRLRVEREVGQLNFNDFANASALGSGASVLRAGNPDLEPASAWVYEASWETKFKGAVLVVTYRRQQIDNVVDRIPIVGSSGVFDAPGNIGSATEDDLLANVTIPLGWLGLKGAQIKGQGTMRHSRVADPTTGQLRTISGQHRYDYDLHFTHDLPKLKSNWGIDVYNRWTETYYRFNEVDVYKLKTWVTVFWEYKPRSDLSIRAEAANVGGRGFQRILYVYSGPRITNGLQYIDNRKQDFKPFLHLRVRKTFG